jgi:formate hydrogenlyase subunit 6/NADH:ubiquinone oxidoreductase subunit I
MSAHLKCEICELNCPKLKYVYYKNFEELERHHRKSHFVCDVGDCITRKLENVFASEALLEEHKRRVHRKYRGDRQ